VTTVNRHGRDITFPDLPGGTETPYVYRDFQRGGWYEEKFLEHIRSQGTTRSSLRPPPQEGVYVDAGAHLGTATAWFAMLCPAATHVHAIEPVTHFADQVQRVIDANDLNTRVTLHRVGVSDQAGTATNHLTAEHQIGFHEVGETRAVDETFEVTTLDDLISDPVAVIKIDVEGMEDRVLRGAHRILTENSPTVYVEAHNRSRLKDIRDVLSPVGYFPTGKVFNATPTYEFSRLTPPGASISIAAHQITYAARRTAWKVAKKVR